MYPITEDLSYFLLRCKIFYEIKMPKFPEIWNRAEEKKRMEAEQ